MAVQYGDAGDPDRAGRRGLAWMFIEWAAKDKPTVLGLISGVVGGLVAITPAAGFVDARGALIIGVVGGRGLLWARPA